MDKQLFCTLHKATGLKRPTVIDSAMYSLGIISLLLNSIAMTFYKIFAGDLPYCHYLITFMHK